MYPCHWLSGWLLMVIISRTVLPRGPGETEPVGACLVSSIQAQFKGCQTGRQQTRLHGHRAGGLPLACSFAKPTSRPDRLSGEYLECLPDWTDAHPGYRHCKRSRAIWPEARC